VAHEFGVYSVAFSPDGRQALSAGKDNLGKIWNLDVKDAVAAKTR